MTISKMIAVSCVAVASIAGMASAQQVELTAAEQATASRACQVGMPLIPVESDYGYDTGEYALPLSEADGGVHSALIISAAVLRDIPECKVEIEAIEREERVANNQTS